MSVSSGQERVLSGTVALAAKMTWSDQHIEQQEGGRTAKRAKGRQEDVEWPGGHWMGCRKGAGCLARSRLAWRRPSPKEAAEQLGGQ